MSIDFLRNCDKVYVAGSSNILQPTCVFCDSPDISHRIQDANICGYHMAFIIGAQPTKLPVSDLRQFSLNRGNSHIVSLDDMGRVLIPAKFYNMLGIKKGGHFTALVHVTRKFAELFPRENGQLRIDEYNRVRLPKFALNHLEWNAADKITVTLDTKHELIRLTLEDKYVPECVFCGGGDIVMRVQGRDICKEHLQEIKFSR